MHNISESRPNTTRIWWHHEFYGARWNRWRENWEKLLYVNRGDDEDSPRSLLRGLAELKCDPEIVIRLAFLVAAHKPSTQSELVKDTRRQQRIKRKLKQAGQRLLDAARLFEEVASEFRPIFIGREQIDTIDQITDLCRHELEVLLEPRALELPSGHELFTLVEYMKASSGQPHLQLVADLLGHVYRAERQSGPTVEVVSKQIQRFARTAKRPDSRYPEVIRDHTAKSVSSGELKKDLLACFPGNVLP